jgi:hypothetical protein
MHAELIYRYNKCKCTHNTLTVGLPTRRKKNMQKKSHCMPNKTSWFSFWKNQLLKKIVVFNLLLCLKKAERMKNEKRKKKQVNYAKRY